MATGKHIGRKSSAQDNFIGPSVPTGVTAVDIGTNRAYNDGAITVSWTAPTNGNTPTGYKVYDGATLKATIAYGTNTTTIAGLSSGTTYTFSVTSYDAFAESAKVDAPATVATTVPATPSAPTATTVANNAQDLVSWTAPATGGKAITNYHWTSDDGKSGDTASTSVTVNQEAGTAQTYNVYATNANGNSGTSASSGSVTTFSFTPFGFTPFGFTPFGFTPFGFTPFGFSSLCFKSLGATTMVQTTKGLVAAHDLVVGDELISADIETMPTSFPGPQSEYPDWSVVDPTVTQTTTTVTAIATRNAESIVVVNGETYSDSHYIFIKRDGISKFINVKDLLLTDLVFSTESSDWVEVLQVDVIPNVSYPVVCINTEPYDVFYTERFLVHDSYTIALDNPVVGQ